jgi:heat shock protein HslJ
MRNTPFARPVATALIAVTLALGLPAAIAKDATLGLEGVDWQLQQFRVDDAMQSAADSERPAVLRFDDGRLSGSAGCNRLMGAYHSDDETLRFEPHTAATMMACPPELMAQEQAVIAAFDLAASYRIKGQSLVIADAQGAPLLKLIQREAMPLTNTSWRLTWYNNGRQAIVSVLAGTQIMLQLRDDGQFAGKACNSYRGGFEHQDSALKVVGPIAATRMACPDPEGSNEQETAYFAALERVSGFRISGNELTLFDDEGTTMAKFEAEKS